MMASYASNLAVLSRHLSDHATTPTATTFAASRASRSGRRRSFTDYDEGDILDDLVGPTPSRLRLQREPRRAVVEEEDDEDDNASTCSSVTAAGADNSSVGSRGRSRHSDVASITSVSEADSRAASVRPAGGNVGNGGKKNRHRRRRGRVAQTEAETISETASETAYETASVTDSVASSIPKNKNNRKSRNNNRVQQLKDDHAKTNSRNNSNVKNSSNTTTKQIKVGRNQSPEPPARRSRSTLGVNSRESTVPSRGKARRSRHPQLIIGLDLDAEIELKSRVQGDICLTLVLEEEDKMARRSSPEIQWKKKSNGRLVTVEEWEDLTEGELEDENTRNGGQRKGLDGSIKTEGTGGKEEEAGEAKVAQNAASSRRGRHEICHMRVARFKLARRWWMEGFEFLGRFPPQLVLFVAAVLPFVGFAAGWAAANWW